CYKECIEHYRNILLQQCKDLSHLIPQITAKSHTEYKRFAICLYGILRGDYIATLEDIITNLAIPLNADVFLFTWDTYQIWPGLGGWTNWALRILTPHLAYDIVPSEIAYLSSCSKLFPNIFQKINSEYNVALDINNIKDLQNKYPCLKTYEIINQEQAQYEGKEVSGHYHLYYGIYRVIETMKQYEISHNITYDFIFTLRSDGDIQYKEGNREQILQDLQTCKSNEIFDTLGTIGNSNAAIYGPRDVILALGSLYDFIKELKTGFYSNIKHNNHAMSFLYLTMCGVTKNKTTTIEQQYGYGTKCQKGLSFPDIQRELLMDMAALQQTQTFNTIKLQSFMDTFEILKREYPNSYVDSNQVVRKAKYVSPAYMEESDEDARYYNKRDEERLYISPQDLKLLFKVLKFIGRCFPNAKVRRKYRKVIALFNFLYKKVYGKNI
ncbi:MAG: hypothetical protein SPJ83_01785, partial [Helicobacter sp.]|uniref:hypothetical protein n=1 Tax=Helicobacter sp. TaxID=218 RepID=UPI002A911AE4